MKKRDDSAFLGKRVHVVVDRPIGYRHGDILYPVNYGYIPGLLAGDGQEQDAYILGVEEPLSEFDGQVIAVIHRRDDVEDKFVVAPQGQRFHQGQIAQAVAFQERFFDTCIVPSFAKSCGVIPVRLRGGKREYLLLLQTNDCWSFPKGHMEAGETEQQTALRELREETGLTAKVLSEQAASCEYTLTPHTRKQVVYFLGLVDGNVTPQETEVRRHRWVSTDSLGKYLHPDTLSACRELIGSDIP